MFVEHFVPKPQGSLEVVEFTGDNGQELASWIVANGGQAVWKDETAEPGRRGMREHIRITDKDTAMYAYVGDYVVNKGDGHFKPARRDGFLAANDKVQEAPKLMLVA